MLEQRVSHRLSIFRSYPNAFFVSVTLPESPFAGVTSF